MKRIISVLLSVVIVFSVNAIAFADASISRRSSYATDKYSGKIGIVNVYASSELIYEGKTFRAGYAVDNDTSTCWQKGAYGWGVGETITLQFDSYYDVRKMSFVIGYTKSNGAYERNGRPSQLNVLFSNGEEYTVWLDDMAAWQTVSYPYEVSANWARFEIAGVYRGTTYSDTCISEIALYE